MEIIDFNPYNVRRRLSAEVEAKTKKGAESGSTLVLGNSETITRGWGNKDKIKLVEGLDDRKAGPGDKPDASSDPKRDEQENRSRVVTDEPFQLPGWISLAAMGCSLPYTSYEIQIPPDLNMDFCIDVMMGQDTIVFMFVCDAHPHPRRPRLTFPELQDDEAGDEYTWSILSF